MKRLRDALKNDSKVLKLFLLAVIAVSIYVINLETGIIDNISYRLEKTRYEKLSENQALNLPSIWNDRQLGGYRMKNGKKIKDNLLIRTARLAEASDEDLAALCDTYHIGTVVDLRTDEEVTHHPDRTIEGSENIHATVVPSLSEPGFSDPFYVGILDTDFGKEGFRKFFRALIETDDGEAFLWHCTSGKDRTGVAAMLLLSVLGASDKTILDDFNLTNAVYDNEPDLPGAGKVYPDDMVYAMYFLRNEYGSVNDYITEELGVTEEEIQLLRKRYLE